MPQNYVLGHGERHKPAAQHQIETQSGLILKGKGYKFLTTRAMNGCMGYFYSIFQVPLELLRAC